MFRILHFVGFPLRNVLSQPTFSPYIYIYIYIFGYHKSRAGLFIKKKKKKKPNEHVKLRSLDDIDDYIDSTANWAFHVLRLNKFLWCFWRVPFSLSILSKRRVISARGCRNSHSRNWFSSWNAFTTKQSDMLVVTLWTGLGLCWVVTRYSNTAGKRSPWMSD